MSLRHFIGIDCFIQNIDIFFLLLWTFKTFLLCWVTCHLCCPNIFLHICNLQIIFFIRNCWRVSDVEYTCHINLKKPSTIRSTLPDCVNNTSFSCVLFRNMILKFNTCIYWPKNNRLIMYSS